VPYKRVLAFLAHGLLIPGYWSGVERLSLHNLFSIGLVKSSSTTSDDFGSDVLLNKLNCSCSGLGDSPRARCVEHL
jgi:hypothetical protein